jgi:hypothetical protein
MLRIQTSIDRQVGTAWANGSGSVKFAGLAADQIRVRGCASSSCAKGELMWCSTCQQEVPGIRNAASGELACVRCGRHAGEAERAGASPANPQERQALLRNLEHWSDHPLLADLDDWELGEQLRHVERLLAIELPEERPAPPHYAARRRGSFARASGAQPERRASVRTSAAWCAMALGLAAVVCGAVLMAVAQLRSRNDLWGLGIPLFALGQLGLVIGLVCEADLARRQGRRGGRASSVPAPGPLPTPAAAPFWPTMRQGRGLPVP